MQTYESHTKEYWIGALNLNVDLERDYASKAEQLKPAAIESMRKYQAGQIKLKEFSEEISEYSFYQKRAYEASQIITKSQKALEWFDSLITCSICSKTFEESENIVDYSDDVCVNCEPNYKEV